MPYNMTGKIETKDRLVAASWKRDLTALTIPRCRSILQAAWQCRLQ
jgi:hypothetical protein